MKPLRRNARLLAFLGSLAAALIVALLIVGPTQAGMPALTTYSAAPNGGKALKLWLEGIGFPLQTLERRPYRVPPGTAALLVLAPSKPLEQAEVDELERWVRDDGGRLLLGAEGANLDAALDRFGFGLRALSAEVSAARTLEHGFLDPASESLRLEAQQALDLRESGARALVGDGEHVFVAERSFGSGTVVAIASPDLLNNRALRQEGNARLALLLVGGHAGGALVFDELHHGFSGTGQRTLMSLLLERSWGHAALYGALLSLLYLVLRGRRFGVARPLVVNRGRSLSEYVTSLGGLYRAGGKRAFVAEHFRRRLRRELAAALGGPGDASDEEIGARARALGREIGPALERLAAIEPAARGEAQLVEAVGAAEAAIAALRRGGATEGSQA